MARFLRPFMKIWLILVSMLLHGEFVFLFPQDDDLIDTVNINLQKGVSFYNQGDFFPAEFSFHRAAGAYHELGRSKSSGMGFTYLNLGAINMMLWRHEEAISYYDSARVIFSDLYGVNHYSYASTLLNIGNIYFTTQDLNKAENYYREALVILRKLSKTENVDSYLATVTNNIGLVLEEAGNYEEALPYYDEAIRFREKTDQESVTLVLRNKADCLGKMGLRDEAEQLFLEVIQLQTRQFGEKHFALGLTWLSYGFFLSQQSEQFSSAMKAYSTALEIFHEHFGEKHPYISTCYKNIGNLFLSSDNPGIAAANFQRALISLSKSFSETNPRDNPSTDDITAPIEFINILKSKSEAFEFIAQRNKEIWPLMISLNSLDTAIKTIDNVRLGYQSEESRLFLSKNQNSIFQDAIRVSYKLYEATSNPIYLEKAFYFAEKNKASLLLASIRELGAREFGGIPADLATKELEIKRQIALFNHYIHEESLSPNPEEGKITLWRQQLFSLNQEYSKLIDLLESQYPAYYKLKYDTSVPGLELIRQKLNKDQALIQYSLADTSLYIFYISGKDMHVVLKRADDTVRTDIEQMLDIFEHRRFSSGVSMDYSAFIRASTRLHELLIKPVAHLLHQQKLIIIPDGILAYLPFELLISEVPEIDEPSYSKLSYLLRSHAISYAHSAALLIETSSLQTGKGRGLMAFAPSYESGNAVFASVQSTRAELKNLKPLPFSKQEVKNILRHVGGRMWIDSEATESNFKKNAYKFKILHLAMHTLLDDLDPMFSKLVFAPEKSNAEDGLLNTYEIYNLNLNACLAVLSSCKSGWGKYETGEGVFSLARGFIYAGVPSIVMTLWEIEDQSSANIMTSFYRYMKKGKKKDEALRLAKLDFLESADMLKSHPYFWGGYVVIGDAQEIFFLNRWRMPGLILLATGILGIIWVYRIRRKRRYLD